MEFTWTDSLAAFEAAALWFVTTAAEVGDRWEKPGLGEWDVRSLVGHTSRSFVTVEAYLAKPPEQVDIESAPPWLGGRAEGQGRGAGAG
jgi:hypothetical protein